MKKITVVLAGLLILAAASAWAIPLTLTISAPNTSSVVVADGSGQDVNPVPGAVTFSGVYGGSWISMATGLYDTVAGQGTQILLSGTDYRTLTGVGKMVINLAVPAVLWPAELANATATGSTTSNGSVAFTTEVNDQTVGSFTSGGGSFLEQQVLPFKPDGDDVVELIAAITQGSGVTTFDYRLTPVPEAGTIMLLGVGFFAVAIYSKRRQNA